MASSGFRFEWLKAARIGKLVLETLCISVFPDTAEGIELPLGCKAAAAGCGTKGPRSRPSDLAVARERCRARHLRIPRDERAETP
jgi:hypothetical protein